MQGFTRRHTVQEALSWLDAQLRTLDAEDVPLREAAGRVLASLVSSDIDVPGFDRATMDGYAVVADSTEGRHSLQPRSARGRRRRDAWSAVHANGRARPGRADHDRRANAFGQQCSPASGVGRYE
jgi:molybdopterin biosynthesis enzyme